MESVCRAAACMCVCVCCSRSSVEANLCAVLLAACTKPVSLSSSSSSAASEESARLSSVQSVHLSSACLQLGRVLRCSGQLLAAIVVVVVQPLSLFAVSLSPHLWMQFADLQFYFRGEREERRGAEEEQKSLD